jgi:hypothetical protein
MDLNDPFAVSLLAAGVGYHAGKALNWWGGDDPKPDQNKSGWFDSITNNHMPAPLPKPNQPRVAYEINPGDFIDPSTRVIGGRSHGGEYENHRRRNVSFRTGYRRRNDTNEGHSGMPYRKYTTYAVVDDQSELERERNIQVKKYEKTDKANRAIARGAVKVIGNVGASYLFGNQRYIAGSGTTANPYRYGYRGYGYMHPRTRATRGAINTIAALF